ncbi:acetyl-CoA synthetase-like protein [Hypoxylon crocopeplum]|nr:acetyl-CoA synthetase-like protein [Hypoxylon crocopeplum]
MEEEATSVCDLFGRWARDQPDHTAIWFESRKISYRELDNAASRIARILSNRQIQPGDIVPVLATRSCEMVASFLGVLKTGACYVPMDIEAWGEERITSTLDRVKASVLVNLGTSEYPGYDVISLDEVKAAVETAVGGEQGAQQEVPRVRMKPTDLAYIVFTSGTTSKPKGVMVSHHSLLSYVVNGDEETPLNTNPRPEDKTLLTFSPGFDGGTGMIFATLCNGAQLIVSAISDFESWAARATIIIVTPSMLSAIHNVKACTQLRTLIIGGEAPNLPLIRKWSAPGRTIFNGYGPTETTVGCLIGRVDPSKPITLGRPTPNNRVVLLDGDSESDYGEICMMGPCLAVGYYQDEALTTQKYPYWHGERIYRTGDFARRTEYGLEFAGRADSFVKNRGFLVNLDSQVITMLLETDAHMATAFMHRGRLVAFVTPETMDVRSLRQSLLRTHDAFLVPDEIRAVQVIPLTPNGKAHNRALQQLLDVEIPPDDNDGLSRVSKMQTLKRAIASATSLPLSEVLNDRGFLDLGGNSLAALKVISYLRSKQLSLDLKDLLNLSDLGAVCDAMRNNGPGADKTAQATIDNDHGDEEEDSVKQELATGPMTALQSKMAHTGLKKPGANASLLRIRIPNTERTFDKFGLRKPDDAVHARSMDIRSRMLSLDEHGETFVPVNVLHLITVPGVSLTLLFSAHHIQADGWSLSLIVNEVQAELLGEELPLTKNSPQFIEVALAQKQQQSNPEGISFWVGILQDYPVPPILNLPKAPSSQKRSEWTSSLELDLGFDVSELEQAARLRGVIPSTLIYAAWGLVLSNHISSDRVAFGAVFSGRNLGTVPGVEYAVGPVFSTVPFPIGLEGKNEVLEMLSTIHNSLLQMLEFQWSAAEVMASMTGENIDRTLQTLVVTEYDLPPNEGPLSWVVDNDDVMEFGISLLIERSASRHDNNNDQALQARILVDSSRYAESSILKLLRVTHLQEVRPKLMDEEEKLFLLQAPSAFDGDTIQDSHSGPCTVKDMFELAVSEWPHLCAIESTRHGTFSYSELGEASNRVAIEVKRHLQEKSPKDVVVGVLSDGSPHWIIAIMAVFKAGYICCPIDIGLPTRRIKAVTQQSGASFFLSSNQSCLDNIQNAEDHCYSFANNAVVIVDEFLQNTSAASTENLETITQPGDTIYLVFTSGSTGVPKGVPLRNLTVLNAVSVPAIRLFAAPGRRISQLSALGFDMALVEIVSSLCYGATLVLKDPDEPFEHLKHVNATFATPSLFSALSPDDYENLDTVALAGESVPQALADTWAKKVQNLINLYGPSECGCASGTLLLPGSEVKLESPRDHGEIYISGVQVVQSYWGGSREHQNKSPFVPNPFSSGPEYDTMYRTGDLGYWNEDMNISYTGRIDNQVKVRGFRVELEEVENALLTANRDCVQNVAAIAIMGGTSEPEDHSLRIVGFITPQDVDVTALRAKLSLLLPTFARPSQIFAVSELPKTSNMKLNREALKTLALEVQQRSGLQEKGDHDLSPTENVIAKAWSDLLGLGKATRIRTDDDFLAIGGNSILAIKAARLITASIGHRIPVALLIRETTLKSLATAIDQHTAASSSDSTSSFSFSAYLSSIRKGTVAEVDGASRRLSSALPLSYLEEEFFRAHSISKAKSAFNAVSQLTINGPVDIENLLKALRVLVQENPILRGRYSASDDHPVRQIGNDNAAPYHYRGNELNFEKLQSLVDKPFDLARESLFRAVVWNRDGSDGDTEMVLIAHHIITDKASLALMLQFISQKYKTLTGGGEFATKDRSSFPSSEFRGHLRQGTYIDWAQWLKWSEEQGLKTSPSLPSQGKERIEFWKQHLSGMHAIPQLQRCAPQTLSGSPGSTQSIRIPHIEGSIATASQPKYSQRLAVAATALALYSVFGTSDLVMGVPYANRDDPATADMLGLFVDRLPIRLLLDEANLASTATLLDAVASEINLCVANYMPHTQIESAVTAADQGSAPGIVDVMVVYDWQSDSLCHSLSLGPGVQVREADNRAKPTGVLFPLQFGYVEQPNDGSLLVEINYDTSIVSHAQVEAMEAVLPDAVAGLARLRTPSSILSAAS